MKNSFAFTFSLLLLCSMSIACNFEFGDTTADGAKREVSQRKSAENDVQPKKKNSRKDKRDASGEKEFSSQSDGDSPERLGDFKYRRLDYSMFLIPKNLSRNELIKVARHLHEQQPKTIILLADDDEQAERLITYHRQLDVFENNPGEERPDFEFPFDWEKKHVVGCVNLFIEGGGLVWYLAEGSYLSSEKIAKLE